MPDYWDPFDDSKLAESHGRLALRMLRFLAAYSRLQDMIDWVIWEWIRLPGDGRSKLFLEFFSPTTITDERRPRFFVGVAGAVNSAVDASNFVATFNRVRNVRNHAAHAMFFNLSDEEGKLSFGVPHYADDVRIKRLENQNSSVDDSVLKRRERDLRWLMEVVEWVAAEAGVRTGPGGLNRTPESAPLSTSTQSRPRT